MGEEEKIESELKGNTLRVYWMLLQSQSANAGVREIQRRLGFSSPALASYHLNKLAELGLVEEKNGEYHLIREVRVGVLKQFMQFGSVMLPRYVLYAAMFTTLFVYFLTQLRDVNFYSVFAFIFGLLGNVVLWYETVRVWRQRP
jgi:DNA-binding transcriptional ArsR family regulator